MKKYSSRQLAELVYQLIQQEYKSVDNILKDSRAIISRGVQSLSKQKLTETEIEKHSLKFANQICDDLRGINMDAIENSISKEIVDISYSPGIELKEHKKYFQDLAKHCLKEFIKSRFRNIKSQIKKSKS